MIFLSVGFHSADAVPDNRFDSTIISVEPSGHFTAFTADDDLGEVVVAAIATFLAISTVFDHNSGSMSQLFDGHSHIVHF